MIARAAALAAALALTACADTPPRIGTAAPYGACCNPLGEGRQPGLELIAPDGTPAVAAADGKVVATGPNLRLGGYFVRLAHGGFDTYYATLSVVDVSIGQAVQRGEKIGLSGQDAKGRKSLYFVVCKTQGSCLDFADSLNPAEHWLGGTLTCFAPGTSYAAAPADRLTAPLACGRYAERLKPPSTKRLYNLYQ